MTKSEREEIRAHLVNAIKSIDRIENIDPSPCMECVHFKETIAFCKLYEKEVPSHIEDIGCDKWEWNYIPF